MKTNIILGDCREVLKTIADNSVDLVFTSPPYADQRKNTYGGIHPDKYVEWFLPIAVQLLRILKPTGTFVLNIKEKAVNGERSTYVLELILAMRKQGWLWTEEFVWHKKIAIPASGQIAFGMLGSGYCSLIRIGNLICIKNPLWCRWEIGHRVGCAI